MSKVNPWTILRWLWTAFWILEASFLAIVDWPSTGKLWYVLCYDPNGVVHELFYVFVGYAVILDLTYWWERRHTDVRLFVVRPHGLGEDNQRKRERV